VIRLAVEAAAVEAAAAVMLKAFCKHCLFFKSIFKKNNFFI